MSIKGNILLKNYFSLNITEPKQKSTLCNNSLPFVSEEEPDQNGNNIVTIENIHYPSFL